MSQLLSSLKSSCPQTFKFKFPITLEDISLMDIKHSHSCVLQLFCHDDLAWQSQTRNCPSCSTLFLNGHSCLSGCTLYSKWKGKETNMPKVFIPCPWGWYSSEKKRGLLSPNSTFSRLLWGCWLIILPFFFLVKKLTPLDNCKVMFNPRVSFYAEKCPVSSTHGKSWWEVIVTFHKAPDPGEHIMLK